MQYLANREPPLDDLFVDPIIRLVMARDHLQVDKLRAQLETVRRRVNEEDGQRATGDGSA